jgi:hypothetical protein
MPDALSLKDIKLCWNDVLDHLESTDRIAWIAYFDARLADFDGASLSLDFSDARKFSGDHEYSPARAKLQNSLLNSIKFIFDLDIKLVELA